MKNKARFLVRYIFHTCLIFFFIIFLSQKVFAEENQAPNPFKELFQWTYQQNVGLTYLYDLDQKKSYIGAKWEFFRTKHEWLMAGLCAGGIGDGEQILGIEVSFNLGKLVEKIKGSPMVYLKHLEAGYYVAKNIQNGEAQDGVILNLIKIEF